MFDATRTTSHHTDSSSYVRLSNIHAAWSLNAIKWMSQVLCEWVNICVCVRVSWLSISHRLWALHDTNHCWRALSLCLSVSFSYIHISVYECVWAWMRAPCCIYRLIFAMKLLAFRATLQINNKPREHGVSMISGIEAVTCASEIIEAFHFIILHITNTPKSIVQQSTKLVNKLSLCTD